MAGRYTSSSDSDRRCVSHALGGSHASLGRNNPNLLGVFRPTGPGRVSATGHVVAAFSGERAKGHRIPSPSAYTGNAPRLAFGPYEDIATTVDFKFHFVVVGVIIVTSCIFLKTRVAPAADKRIAYPGGDAGRQSAED